MFLMGHSVIYEMIEWLAAMRFGGDLGVAYLGTQGDEWDAHKDMALAGLGAVLALLGTWGLNRLKGRDLTLDWLARVRGARA
jgi:putative membrane protein